MPTPITIPADFSACPHDRGPGIAVCLRCRADSHQKAAAARRRLAVQLGIGAGVIVALMVAGNGALAARMRMSSSATPVTAGRQETFRVTQAGTTEPAARTAAPATPAPLVPAGRTALEGGMYVERADDALTVHFDTPTLRTRRRDKFENVVRATLPAVYGAVADSALDALPAGALAGGGDLLTELPSRGIRLPARDGWALTLYPGTRPGQDGPLVVSYRIAIAPAR